MQFLIHFHLVRCKADIWGLMMEQVNDLNLDPFFWKVVKEKPELEGGLVTFLSRLYRA